MTLYETINNRTRKFWEDFSELPLVRALEDDGRGISEEVLAMWLSDFYHYTKHTVPKLLFVGDMLLDTYPALSREFLEHALEEHGHDQLVLNDLAYLGFKRDSVIYTPSPEARNYTRFTWDMIHRNPIAILGEAKEMENVAYNYAGKWARKIERTLGLEEGIATSFLRVHAEADPGHVGKFMQVINGITNPKDQATIMDMSVGIWPVYLRMFSRYPVQEP